jgi:hypothetical protein
VPVFDVQTNNVEIRGLKITGATASSAVRVPGTLWSVNVVNCVLYGNQLAFNGAGAPGINFVNNTCYGPEGVFASGGGSCMIRNNIIYATGAYAIESTICSSDFNLYYAPSGSVGISNTVLYATVAQWRSSGVGVDTFSIGGDPLFVNPGSGDFRLQAASPAIGKGASGSPAPVTDAEGYARNVGGNYDMGAFEFRP